MRGDQVQTNPSCRHFYLSICIPHLCVCACVCTEDVSACNCSFPLSFLLPCCPSLYWSSHIASSSLLMFCFAAKKKTNVSNKNNEGVLSADARCQGDSEESGAICQAQTQHQWQSCPAPGASRAPKWKASASPAWAELCGWKQADAHCLWIRQREELLTHIDY